jgi:hypothetical protein
LSWQLGIHAGGSPVIDFRVSYAENFGEYSIIGVNIVPRNFTAKGLIPGTVYKFKVQARNEFGYSEYSNEVLVLAAQTPDAPSPPSTSINN